MKIAVVHGSGNVAQVMNKIKSAKEAGAELPYHFVEVMACRGGCVAGGGQPMVMLASQPKPHGITDDIRAKRSAGLVNEDSQANNRLSHHNESVKALYKEYLGEAGGEKAHKLLHNHYHAKNLYN